MAFCAILHVDIVSTAITIIKVAFSSIGAIITITISSPCSIFTSQISKNYMYIFVSIIKLKVQINNQKCVIGSEFGMHLKTGLAKRSQFTFLFSN
jgi:hypothetical protein